MPKIIRLLESALYVDDVERAVKFYRGLFDFDLLFKNERGAGLSVSGKQVLLLFRKRGTRDPVVSDRGTIPAHDGDGNLHVAFAVSESELASWERRLAEKNIGIVGRYEWERGGRSVYFNDPDGHVLELVTPGCWTIY